MLRRPSGSGPAWTLPWKERTAEDQRGRAWAPTAAGTNEHTFGDLTNEPAILQFRKLGVPIGLTGPKLGCWQGHSPPAGSGGASGLFQGGCWPHHASALTLLHIFCLSLGLDPLIIQNDRPHLQVLNLLASAKCLSPYKVVPRVQGDPTHTRPVLSLPVGKGVRKGLHDLTCVAADETESVRLGFGFCFRSCQELLVDGIQMVKKIRK